MSVPTSVSRAAGDGTRDVAQWAAAIAAHGLATSLLPFPHEPLDSDRWAALSAKVTDGRVPGLWVQAIEDGTLAASPTQVQEAVKAHTLAKGMSALLEGFLVEAVAVLKAAGIDYRVLKGPAVAHLDYPDRRLRSFGDIDLLVPADQFDQAIAAFRAAGYTRQHRELRPGFERRFGKGAELNGSNGFELDLHRTFTASSFGLRSQPADLFTGSESFEIAGVSLQALAAEDRFLHACFHSALSRSVRLSSLRDVAQLLLCRQLDLDLVRQRADTWRAAAVLARGVALTWDTLGLIDASSLSAWAASYQPDHHELRALRSWLGDEGDRPSQVLEGLRAIRGVRSKAAYAWAFILPTYRHHQGGHLRFWWRAVRIRVPNWFRFRRGKKQSV